MEIVADTNVFLAVALNESQKGKVIALTADALVTAPEILPYEVGNALSAMVKRRRLTEAEALLVEKATRRIPVRLVDVDVQASLELAFEHEIYAYDAYFLRCALELSQPLLTLDRRMQHVAQRLGIQLLE